MLKIDDLVIDKEFEELLPVLTPEEFERLEQSVLKNGMLDPIKVWEEPNTGRYIIIDGHNRYNILKKNNLGFKYWEDYKIMFPLKHLLLLPFLFVYQPLVNLPNLYRLKTDFSLL